MSSKVFFMLCAQAVFAHVAFSQCIHSGGKDAFAFAAPCAAISPYGSHRAHSWGCDDRFNFGIGSGFAGVGLGSAGFESGGGAFPIESLTPIAPNGIAVTSENVYEGALGVVGELPFLSTVALEGVLPSAGAGIVNHGCGNGITAITSEIDGFGAGIIGPGGIGSGIIGAGGIGSGIIGAGGIGSGIIGAGGIVGASGIGSGAVGCAKPWKHLHWNGMGGYDCGCY